MNINALHAAGIVADASVRAVAAAQAHADRFVLRRMDEQADLLSRAAILQARCDLANTAMVRWGALLYQATPEGALPNLAPTGQILLSMPWSRRRHAAYGLSDVDARVLAAWVRGRLAELPRSAQVLLYGAGERRWYLARDYAPATAEGFAAWWRDCMWLGPDSWLAAVTVAGLQRGQARR